MMEGDKKRQIQNLLEIDADVIDKARNFTLCGPPCNNTLHVGTKASVKSLPDSQMCKELLSVLKFGMVFM